MRSAVADSCREVSTDDSVGHDDDNGNAQKRHFRCGHSLARTRVSSGIWVHHVMNLTAGATEV